MDKTANKVTDRIWYIIGSLETDTGGICNVVDDPYDETPV